MNLPDEDIKLNSSEQRDPSKNEPKCIICGKYAEYICDQTDSDICSIQCKLINLSHISPPKLPIPAHSIEEFLLPCIYNNLSYEVTPQMLQLLPIIAYRNDVIISGDESYSKDLTICLGIIQRLCMKNSSALVLCENTARCIEIESILKNHSLSIPDFKTCMIASNRPLPCIVRN